MPYVQKGPMPMLIALRPAPPRVTVVVPAYRQARHLPLALQSLAHQTTPDWGAVIVDDGSNDDGSDSSNDDGSDSSNDGSNDGATLAAAGAFLRSRPPGQVTVLAEAHGGVARARNLGLQRVESPEVLFLDADDELLPPALARLSAALGEAPDAVAAYGQPLFVGEDSQPIPTSWTWNEAGAGSRLTFADACPDPHIYPPGCVLVRRWAAIAAGGFDAAMVAYEDQDFWLRLLLVGPMVALGDVACLYRRHGGNATGNLDRMRPWLAVAERKTLAYQQAWQYRRTWPDPGGSRPWPPGVG